MSDTQGELFGGDDVEWGSELELPKGTEGLEQRYQKLTALAQSGNVIADDLLQENAEKLKEITVLLEIESGLETPAEEKQYRMELQVSRLSGGLGGRKNHGDGQKSSVLQALSEWCDVGPVASGVRGQYMDRFKAALETLG